MTEDEDPWNREIEWVECPNCGVLTPEKQVKAYGQCERHLSETEENRVTTDSRNAAPSSNSIIDDWKQTIET